LAKSLSQVLPHGRLPGARCSDDEAGVTDIEDIVELLVLQDKARISLQSSFHGYLGCTSSQGVVLGLLCYHIREESVDQPHEDRFVDCDDLCDVEVSQGSEEDDVLVFVSGSCTLELTGLPE
jgi:hypothetical protein